MSHNNGGSRGHLKLKTYNGSRKEWQKLGKSARFPVPRSNLVEMTTFARQESFDFGLDEGRRAASGSDKNRQERTRILINFDANAQDKQYFPIVVRSRNRAPDSKGISFLALVDLLSLSPIVLSGPTGSTGVCFPKLPPYLRPRLLAGNFNACFREGLLCPGAQEISHLSSV